MTGSISLGRAVSLALAVVPCVAYGGQLDYTLYAGLEHSSNINLATSDPTSEDVLTPGVAFSFSQQGSTVQANAIGTLEYRDYLNNRFDNQTQVQLASQLNWTVLPQRLDFAVEDYAGVQPVDTLASDAPNNQQQTNLVSLGPTLHLQFGPAVRGEVDLRYLNSYASRVDTFNSQRVLGAFRLIRDVTPTDQLSANLQVQRITFDNQGQTPDYTRQEGYLRYVSQLARFNADVTLGWTRLDFGSGGSRSKPLVRVVVGWQPSVRQGLQLATSYAYSDAAQDMMLQPGQRLVDLAGDSTLGLPTEQGGGITTGNLVIDSQVYLERDVQLTYSYHAPRLDLTVSPIYRKLSYVNLSDFDQSGRGLSLGASYRLDPRTTLTGFASYDRLAYQQLERVDKTYRYGLDLSQQWTPHWAWHVALERQLRSSTAAQQSYHENAVFFSVSYRR